MKSSLIFFLSLAFSLNVSIAKTLNGAGASFPYPIYSKWFSEYSKVDPNTRFNYRPIGSGGGVRQLIAQTVDFGASDVPLTEKDKKKLKEPVIQVPMVIGAVVLAFNAPGVNDLILNYQVITDIFMGKIRKWNHQDIKKLNPGVSLPNLTIATIQRADSSGTTAVFTNFLSNISSEWKEKVGAGKSVRWPRGFKAKGNDGVTNIVKNTPGAIGYIELAYAINNKLSYAKIVNRNGIVSTPTLENVSKSAEEMVQMITSGKKDELVGSIVNSGRESAYPISAMTYLLIPQKNNKVKTTEIQDFVLWSLGKGQKMAKEMHYAPIPESLTSIIKKKLKNL